MFTFFFSFHGSCQYFGGNFIKFYFILQLVTFIGNEFLDAIGVYVFIFKVYYRASDRKSVV